MIWTENIIFLNRWLSFQWQEEGILLLFGSAAMLKCSFIFLDAIVKDVQYEIHLKQLEHASTRFLRTRGLFPEDFSYCAIAKTIRNATLMCSRKNCPWTRWLMFCVLPYCIDFIPCLKFPFPLKIKAFIL